MGRLLKAFASDRRGAITADYVVLAVAFLALAIAVFGAVRSGTFEAIANVINEVETSGGCVTRASTGTTDLSNCN